MTENTRFGKVEHDMIDGFCSTCGEAEEYLKSKVRKF